MTPRAESCRFHLQAIVKTPKASRALEFVVQAIKIYMSNRVNRPIAIRTFVSNRTVLNHFRKTRLLGLLKDFAFDCLKSLQHRRLFHNFSQLHVEERLIAET